MRNIRSSSLRFIVQKCHISNKEALVLIASGRLTVNGTKAHPKQAISLTDEVLLDGLPLQIPQKFIYVLYHKPKGVESTLNQRINDNLTTALEGLPRLFPVGRLDKDSEGLMLLTNNGMLYNKIVQSKYEQEKEYVVNVDKELTDSFLSSMAGGMEILGKKTLPAKVIKMSRFSFRITLVQGLNRQIRRMCHKGGYKVVILKRIRIAHLQLVDLEPGKWRYLRQEELEFLHNNLIYDD